MSAGKDIHQVRLISTLEPLLIGVICKQMKVLTIVRHDSETPTSVRGKEAPGKDANLPTNMYR